jgi:hypothetical protein
MDDEITITFVKPIKLGEIEYSQVTLTEPTYSELVAAGKKGADLEQLGHLIHLNAKLPMAVVERLKKRDLDACAGFFGSFGSVSPPMPETSSQS